MKFLFAFLILLVLYALSLQGRRGHPGWDRLLGFSYAHRGLHDDIRPENSLSAFRGAMEHGYGVELDVHMMADGHLAVIHDSSLKRTAGVDVRIEDLTAAQLQDYHLEGTSETIPLFADVLKLFDGKVPMIVELKPERGNYAALCRKACDMMKEYSGPYCMESFDPRCVLWLKQQEPQIIRGQLSENYFKGDSKLPWYLKLMLVYHLEYFLTRPDFVAYKFVHRKNLSNFLVRKLWKVQGVTWTLQSQDEHDAALAEGWIPIFENYHP